MNNYHTYNHVKTSLRYHIIFSTKYHRKCLEPIREIVIESFRYVESISHFKILAMETDKDHIHILVTFPPSYSIEQTARRIKQVSTNYIYERYGEYLKQYYWKRREFYGRMDISVQILEKYQKVH